MIKKYINSESMRSQTKFKTLIISILLSSALLFSCTNHMEEYYEPPAYLKGNAWELLAYKGNYTLFLAAIEKAGYKTLVNGKGLITLMAPNNEAFEAYLAKKGYASIDEIPIDELKKLVAYHIVNFTYNKAEFAHYNPYGSGNENPLEMGLFYKHRTNAKNPFTIELDYSTLPATEVTVVHKELYLPIMSGYLFATKRIDAKYNYEYFYPNTTWTGDNTGYNVSNASVSEYEAPTDNGFVNFIDQVLEPLETIYQSLQNQGNYNSFLSMYDKFSYYLLDPEATADYGNGTNLYIHKHLYLPNIASEWTYDSNDATYDAVTLTKNAYNVFVPDNIAMDAFYQEYWAPYYNSVSDVYFLQQAYLLYNHVYTGSIVFPQEIKEKKIVTAFGTPISFDPDKDVTISQVCTNGSYYSLKTVQIPDMFKSVTGPAFRNSSYTMFLYMLYGSGTVLPLASRAIDYTLFIPANTQITNSGYYDLPIQYSNPNAYTVTDDELQILDGAWRPMSYSEMTNFVNSHTATELLTETSGIKVYKTKNDFSYLYMKGNSIASNKMYNEDAPFANITKIEGDWYNGSTYQTDTVLLKVSTAFKYEVSSADETPYLKDYEEFSKLLTLAGLLPLNAPLDFITDNYMVFIPTNETILNAPIGTIPTDPTALAQYLKYYFIPTSPNQISDYPFSGTVASGDLKTYQIINNITNESSTVHISEVAGKIHLISPNGQADVVSELPNVYTDGAVYLIDGLIQP